MALAIQAWVTVRMDGDHGRTHAGTADFYFSDKGSNGKVDPEIGRLRLLTQSRYFDRVKHLANDEKPQIGTVTQGQNPPQEGQLGRVRLGLVHLQYLLAVWENRRARSRIPTL